MAMKLLAGDIERSTAEAAIMEERRVIEICLQLPSLRNRSTQPIVAHIQRQPFQTDHLLGKTPVDLIVADIQLG